MYVTKADRWICALRNLVLDTPRTIHGVRRSVIVCADNLSRLVVNAEHKPRRLKATQVRLIRQRREILSDLVARKALAATLELDNFVFPIGQKGKKRNLFLV